MMFGELRENNMVIVHFLSDTISKVEEEKERLLMRYEQMSK